MVYHYGAFHAMRPAHHQHHVPCNPDAAHKHDRARDTGAETQPVPNPLSWWLHVMVPVWFQKLSTLVNHIVELPAPFLLLMPRPWRTWGGVIQVCCHV